MMLGLAGLDLIHLIESVAPGKIAPGSSPPVARAKEIGNNLLKLTEETNPLPGDFPAHFLSLDECMEPRFQQGDVVYFEANTTARTVIAAKAVYLVSFNGRTVVRYLRMGAHRLYLASEESLEDPARWDYVSLADRHILEVVKGRVVWICRKMETVEAGSFEEAGGDD